MADGWLMALRWFINTAYLSHTAKKVSSSGMKLQLGLLSLEDSCFGLLGRGFYPQRMKYCMTYCIVLTAKSSRMKDTKTSKINSTI